MKKFRPYLIVLYMIALVIVGAAGDALMDIHGKNLGHWLQLTEVYGAFFMVLAALWGVLLKNVFVYEFQMWKLLWALFAAILAYTFIRFALFDYFWNWVAGEHWDYLGSTEWTDGIKSKILPSGLVFIRFIFLSAGIGIIFKEL